MVKVMHLTTTDMSLELLLGPQLEAFIQAGFDVVGVSAQGQFVEKLAARGVRHVPLRHSTRSMSPLHDIRAACELYAILRKEKPDVLHTHNPKPGLYGRPVGWLARVPLVVNTVHGLYVTETDGLAKRAIVYALELFASLFSNVELIQNVEDLTQLRKIGVAKKKLHLLGNGIEIKRYQFGKERKQTRDAIRKTLGVSSDTIVVGAVGRLVKEKGYRELISAACSFKDRGQNVVFVVVGPFEPDKSDSLTNEEIERARECGVIFIGFRDDVENIYASLDIYVLASYREGFPRSAMEAAASGLPLVLTNIRGCRQVVEDEVTGLLVKPRDTDSLMVAISRLVEDANLRKRLGKAAELKARECFDVSEQIKITLEAYRSNLDLACG